MLKLIRQKQMKKRVEELAIQHDMEKSKAALMLRMGALLAHPADTEQAA
ncbi:MAG: hypothetical protein HC855_15995 [Rhizobiales bacterium]|nr:hypothetical protein [Hyphomicrobiales bacterium]